jgi:hypothetical protein
LILKSCHKRRIDGLSVTWAIAQKQVNKGMCHTTAWPFTLKKCVKAKEELWKLKYFTMQKYILQKTL